MEEEFAPELLAFGVGQAVVTGDCEKREDQEGLPAHVRDVAELLDWAGKRVFSVPFSVESLRLTFIRYFTHFTSPSNRLNKMLITQLLYRVRQFESCNHLCRRIRKVIHRKPKTIEQATLSYSHPVTFLLSRRDEAGLQL